MFHYNCNKTDYIIKDCRDSKNINNKKKVNSTLENLKN